MELKFFDIHGNQGTIDEDFSVEYDGAEPVEEYVQEVLNQASTDREAMQNLIIDMNDDLGIREVRKVE